MLLMYKNPGSHASPLLSNPKPTPPPQLQLPPNPYSTGHESHRNPTSTTSPSSRFSPLRRIMLAAASWLRTRRSRCIFLIFCSPILLPFLVATFPILCAAELCIQICRRGQRRKDGDEEERLRRCEEGCCNCNPEGKEVGLLQRYLEDQLRLVGSMYECGDEFDAQNEHDNQNLDFKTPLLA